MNYFAHLEKVLLESKYDFELLCNVNQMMVMIVIVNGLYAQSEICSQH